MVGDKKKKEKKKTCIKIESSEMSEGRCKQRRNNTSFKGREEKFPHSVKMYTYTDKCTRIYICIYIIYTYKQIYSYTHIYLTPGFNPRSSHTKDSKNGI